MRPRRSIFRDVSRGKFVRRLQELRPGRSVPSPTPPSLDTNQITCEDVTGQSLTALDDWRRGVAWALRDLGPALRWEQANPRAARWVNCGRASWSVVRECIHAGDAQYLYPYRCELRTCPECAKRLSRAIAASYSSVLMRTFRGLPAHVRRGEELATDWRPLNLPPGGPKGRRWRIVTLTRPNPGGWDPERLLHQVRDTRRMVTELWRETWGSYRAQRVKADDAMVGAVFGVEVSPNGMVHAHVLVFGHYWPQPDLAARWERITGDSRVVDVRAVRISPRKVAALAAEGRKATFREYLVAGVLEVLKYAVKPPELVGGEGFKALAAIEYAYAGTRRIGSLGIFFGRVAETMADPEYSPPIGGVCCPTCEAPAHLGELTGPGGTAARLRFGAAWHPATHPPPREGEFDHGQR